MKQGEYDYISIYPTLTRSFVVIVENNSDV